MDGASENFPTVKVSVAAASGTREGVSGGCAVFAAATGHKLAAAVVGVAADGGSVVPHALSILDIVVGISGLVTILFGRGFGLHHVAVFALIFYLS